MAQTSVPRHEPPASPVSCPQRKRITTADLMQGAREILVLHHGEGSVGHQSQRISKTMLDCLITLGSPLSQGGYLILFLAAMLAASTFLGLLASGELCLFLWGVCVGRGLLQVDCVIIVGVLGTLFGGSLSYALGRRLGRPWLVRHRHWISWGETHLTHVDAVFARHGGKTVFFSRFLGHWRALAPFVAGAAHLPYAHFLRYDVLGAVCWTMTFVLVGYFSEGLLGR